VTPLPKQSRAYQAALSRPGGYKARELAGRLSGQDSCLVDELVRLLTGPYVGTRCVVYCETLAVLALAEAALSRVGIDSCSIQGSTDGEARTDLIDRFKAGEAQVLLGSRVLERGVDGLQCVDLLITLDCSEVADREGQREGRIVRLGSAFTTVEHVVLLPDTPLVRKKWARLEQRGHRATQMLTASR
jgi:superfamily II DNA or RNA helicase